MIYNLKSGVNQYEVFEDSELALAARYRKEQELGPEYELVVLSGLSIDEVRKTHGRFFRLENPLGGQLDLSQLA